MEARRTGKSVGNPLSTTHAEVDIPTPQTEAEKAETARRLNPLSRSQLKLDEISKRPAGMTPVPQKKSKPTKWQFGIRSRNQPLEAIGCIYRALQKLGAQWTLDEEEWSPRQDGSDDDRYEHSSSLKYILTNSRTNNNSFISNASGASLHHSGSMAHGDRSSMRFSQLDPNMHYKLPSDPWVLRVRWKTDGMFSPGTSSPSSNCSSPIDVCRQSAASMSSEVSSTSKPKSESSKDKKNDQGKGKDSVIMHLDIQLYEMEPGVYLVDFKCSGYEMPDGLLEEKDVTSPFPFLDLASKLIIQLAEAD